MTGDVLHIRITIIIVLIMSLGDYLPPHAVRNKYRIARAERDGTRAETRFRLSLKRTSPFKSVGVSVQSTAGSRGVRISLSNAG